MAKQPDTTLAETRQRALLRLYAGDERAAICRDLRITLAQLGEWEASTPTSALRPPEDTAVTAVLRARPPTQPADRERARRTYEDELRRQERWRQHAATAPVVVHLAGEIVDGSQRCVRCGYNLPIPPGGGGWPPGAHILNERYENGERMSPVAADSVERWPTCDQQPRPRATS